MSSSDPRSLARIDRMHDALPVFVRGVTYAGLVALVVNEFTERAFARSIVPSSDLKVKIVIGVLIMLAISVNLRLGALHQEIARIKGERTGMLEVLSPYESLDMRELLLHNNHVRILTLSGTKAAHLGDAGVQEVLSDLSRKSNVTILLANPMSPAVVTRYQQDEPATYEAGVEGITRRLVWLSQLMERLPEMAKSKIDIRVYNSYPTISIVQADDELYSTVYGFRLRGGDCPRVRVDAAGSYGRFLVNHFDKVYEAATPLQEWVRVYKGARAAAQA